MRIVSRIALLAFTPIAVAQLTAARVEGSAPPPSTPPSTSSSTPVGTAQPGTPAGAATTSPSSATPTNATAPGARARAAVARLKGTLVGELTKALADGGPAHAVNVCGDVAARVRKEVEREDLRIGRTSSRLRNPQNAAPTWVTPVLAELERATGAARAPREVALPDGGLGYVEPLVAAPLCLQCHGTAVAPEVRAAIAAKYPADKAVGFSEGDLRGVAWVELKGAAHEKGMAGTGP